MEIKLSQAITLVSIIKKRIQELKSERNQAAFNYVIRGEQSDQSDVRPFDQICDEIEEAQNDLLYLETQIAKANALNTVEWDGREITIGEAIQLAKLYREQATEYGYFGAYRQNEIDRVRSAGNTVIMRVLNYDPKLCVHRQQKLLRKANKLSDLIDEANIMTRINFPKYSKYMD